MDSHLRLARALSNLLDSKFGFGSFRIGLDPIIGLIPGFGDALGLILSLYIVWIGIQLGLPQEKIFRMVTNAIIDFILGIIPVVGDVADFFYKANSMNMKIIEEYRENIIEGQVIE